MNSRPRRRGPPAASLPRARRDRRVSPELQSARSASRTAFLFRRTPSLERRGGGAHGCGRRRVLYVRRRGFAKKVHAACIRYTLFLISVLVMLLSLPLPLWNSTRAHTSPTHTHTHYTDTNTHTQYTYRRCINVRVSIYFLFSFCAIAVWRRSKGRIRLSSYNSVKKIKCNPFFGISQVPRGRLGLGTLRLVPCLEGGRPIKACSL